MVLQHFKWEGVRRCRLIKNIGEFFTGNLVWKLAGVEPGPLDTWYRSLDQGMGATLNVAAGINAYTLTDRATCANFNNRQHLEILTEGDPALLNPYASIVVNPAKWPHVKFSDART
jgi:tungstate transport system substrate-binding protein